ncbi:hypothetical protein L6164_018755 [Bauhinia variegata]|uniref:Uncharacterized protein n=1 Tax=Bauhinia variegata TaxID=167791 RepID=A0ACB9NCX2_BAUVA|nr:hypothetical protein L6164_018755 [Bauhinia variegata]
MKARTRATKTAKSLARRREGKWVSKRVSRSARSLVSTGAVSTSGTPPSGSTRIVSRLGSNWLEAQVQDGLLFTHVRLEYDGYPKSSAETPNIEF